MRLPRAVAAFSCVLVAVCACGESTGSSQSQGGRSGFGSSGGSSALEGGNGPTSGGVAGSVECLSAAGAANVFVADISGTGCLPRSLPVTEGRARCAVVEVFPSVCRCAGAPGERTPSPAVDLAVRSHLQAAGAPFACDAVCVCALDQLDGAALASCQNDEQPNAPPGFCYVDPSQGVGSAELVRDCTTSDARRLRYVGERFPGNGSAWMIACGDGI
ncbi:MAG TPA: hypothetical protein VFQ35_27475 [Polyangiaceae bacterium]|nr:hypothetical protein [Polyangiaceae bacterium]